MSGRRRRGNSSDLSGLIILDKPSGMTSHTAVEVVRRLTGQSRIGHGGTLDPLATGVLPLLLGNGTRLLQFLTSDPKVYRTTVLLGVETTTGDADGEHLAAPRAVTATDAEIRDALGELRGELQQIPPMYSAKKVNGKRLYKHARAGDEIERKPSTVTVHGLELLARRGHEIDLEVTCSPGTYVRSIATDLGRSLGCGGTVTVLRRLRSGSLSLQNAVTLDDLSAETTLPHLLPIDQIPLTVGEVEIADDDGPRFQSGMILEMGIGDDSSTVAVRTSSGQFLGVGVLRSGTAGPRLQPKVVFPPPSGQAS